MRLRRGFAVAVLWAVSCSPASTTNPIAPVAPHSTISMNIDDMEASSVFPTWQEGGAQGDFRVHPFPTEGAPPLTVHVNMCHSTDPSPGIDLHYKVTWGDQSADTGFCRFTHVYPSSGRFTAVACVWDRIPAHAPGACDTFTVSAAAPPPPAPLAPSCPFTTSAASTWQGVTPQNCFCPATGQTAPFLPNFFNGCIANGFLSATWMLGGKCYC